MTERSVANHSRSRFVDRRFGCFVLAIVFAVVLTPCLWFGFRWFQSTNEDFTINGLVVDEKNYPLAGVTVNAKIISEPWLQIPAPWSGRLESRSVAKTTDSDGRFVLSGSGVSVQIGLEMPGYSMPSMLGPDYDVKLRGVSQADRGDSLRTYRMTKRDEPSRP